AEDERVPRGYVRGECQTAGGRVAVRVVVLLDERRRIRAHSSDRVEYPESEGVPAGVRGCRGRLLTVPAQREGQSVTGGDGGGVRQRAGRGVPVRVVVLLDERVG